MYWKREEGGGGLAGPPLLLWCPLIWRRRHRKYVLSLHPLAPKARKKTLPQTVEGEEGGGGSKGGLLLWVVSRSNTSLPGDPRSWGPARQRQLPSVDCQGQSGSLPSRAANPSRIPNAPRPHNEGRVARTVARRGRWELEASDVRPGDGRRQVRAVLCARGLGLHAQIRPFRHASIVVRHGLHSAAVVFRCSPAAATEDRSALGPGPIEKKDNGGKEMKTKSAKKNEKKRKVQN